ncbi:hypothetical protein TNCV_1788771 [Trichonephila clavipes]|nr:hypothetical protein TNCV_1788771 [Trichonephila clavipes]
MFLHCCVVTKRGGDRYSPSFDRGSKLPDPTPTAPMLRYSATFSESPDHDHSVTATSTTSKAAFTPRQSASRVERLANQRLHLARDKVSDWLDAQCPTLTALM